LNLFRVDAFLNYGLNLFHDLIVEGKKEFANNCNLVNGFLNSVWLRKFNSFSSRIKGSKLTRPLLEYACELWDGCTILDLNKIEQVQHEAARIVSGLPKFASIESLYLYDFYLLV
jgi:hypothetical protein